MECSYCVTQNMDCYRTCGSNTVGHMDENIIDMIVNTKSELDCKMMCADIDECQWYTYFYKNDPLYHELCFLLTEFLWPGENSDTASSGPPDCFNKNATDCFLEINGEKHGSLMLTDTETDFSIKTNGSCRLRVLAVGEEDKGMVKEEDLAI